MNDPGMISVFFCFRFPVGRCLIFLSRKTALDCVDTEVALHHTDRVMEGKHCVGKVDYRLSPRVFICVLSLPRYLQVEGKCRIRIG